MLCLQITPTEEITEIQGVPVRVWSGKDLLGRKCRVMVAMVGTKNQALSQELHDLLHVVPDDRHPSSPADEARETIEDTITRALATTSDDVDAVLKKIEEGGPLSLEELLVAYEQRGRRRAAELGREFIDELRAGEENSQKRPDHSDD